MQRFRLMGVYVILVLLAVVFAVAGIAVFRARADARSEPNAGSNDETRSLPAEPDARVIAPLLPSRE